MASGLAGWLKETDYQAVTACRNHAIDETYEYDAIGNLKKTIDRNGLEIDYDYDALNRRGTKTWVGANPPYSVTYTYDLASRLTQVTDPTGTYTFTP